MNARGRVHTNILHVLCCGDVAMCAILSLDDIVALHHIAADEAEDLALILEPFVDAAPAALVGAATQDTLPVQHLLASLRWRTRAYRRLQVHSTTRQ